MNNLKFEVFANSRNWQCYSKLKFRNNGIGYNMLIGQFMDEEKLEDKKGEKQWAE